ncbi:MAG: hypothetical protein AUK47_14900 [Deltaproteobacteria bacterium CG2_30_63_29]|nr:MAG: hypothetical protein AUK47_14900 [Deltaproteobacteria bacterium CG2_30_63_29]
MATFLRWGGAFVLVGCLFVVSCSEPGPGDRSTGSDRGPGLVLTVPDGALADPGVEFTIAELALVPRGAVRAWELGPDGTQFAEPVVLEAEYGDFELPPGVDAASLTLSVYVDERWVGLADSKNDLDKKIVRATTTHFSIYGLVPDPKEVDGRGLLWEANGVSLTADAVHFARLSVSPTAVSAGPNGERLGCSRRGLFRDMMRRTFTDTWCGTTGPRFRSRTFWRLFRR